MAGRRRKYITFTGANGTKLSYPATKRRRRVMRSIRRTPARANARTGGFVDIENKFLDLELTSTALSSTWAAYNPTTADCISATAIGNTESTRDGRVYYINSVHLKGSIRATTLESQTGPISDLLARIVVVMDTQTNAAEVTALDVMDGDQTDDVYSFRNLQNTKRFRVLMDKTIKVPRASINTNEGAANLFAAGTWISYPFQYNLKFKKPVKVRCVGTTAVVGSISDNSIGVIAVASSTEVSLNYQSRIRFSG